MDEELGLGGEVDVDHLPASITAVILYIILYYILCYLAQLGGEVDVDHLPAIIMAVTHVFKNIKGIVAMRRAGGAWAGRASRGRSQL